MKFKLLILTIIILLTHSSFAKDIAINQHLNVYELGFENDMVGVTMLYDNTSSFSKGSSCKNSCYKTLNSDAQQWVYIDSAPGAWAALGYSLCKDVDYDASGAPKCVDYLGYITVSLNHNTNQIKPGNDDISKEFFKTLTFSKKSGVELYSITSTYQPPQAPKLNDAKVYTSGLTLRGTNLAGAEFGSQFSNSAAPTKDDAAYEAQFGVNTYRIPIRAEYALDQLTHPTINMPYINSIKPTITSLLEKGYYVILDLHNYMRYCPTEGAGACNRLLTADELISIWKALLGNDVFGNLAQDYPKHFAFDLMNEPQDIDAGIVVSYYNQTISMIRDNGFKNLLLLEGTQWSGLHSWSDSGNADAFKQIIDLGKNFAINVHQYFDANYSGVGATCVSPENLLTVINANAFITWLKENKAKAIVTEFGAPDNDNCVSDLTRFVTYLQDNAYTDENGYGFIGWTTWSSGHAWDDNYQMNFQGPSGVNYHLWKDLFVDKNFITPASK